VLECRRRKVGDDDNSMPLHMSPSLSNRGPRLTCGTRTLVTKAKKLFVNLLLVTVRSFIVFTLKDLKKLILMSSAALRTKGHTSLLCTCMGAYCIHMWVLTVYICGCLLHTYVGAYCIHTWVLTVYIRGCLLFTYVGAYCIHMWVLTVYICGCLLYTYMGAYCIHTWVLTVYIRGLFPVLTSEDDE
jgi:hypothetical protein